MKKAVIQNLAFDERGLISAVIQLRGTGQVLARGCMNAEALMRSLQSGYPHLFEAGPPSVVARWQIQDREVRITDVKLAESSDFLMVLVDWISVQSGSAAPINPAPEPLAGGRARAETVRPATLEAALRLDQLVRTVKALRGSQNERSATAKLFMAGLDSILLSLGSNAQEVIIAAKNNLPSEIKSGMSQLLHTFLVLMVERGLTLDELIKPLAERAGLDELRRT